ncbi:MAG: Gfo/Idh/MocA family protein, partial [Gammaproteobacteria bacterium]
VFAEENGIPCVEKDYAALVTSDSVDLVYNGLPPSGHARWTIAALEAGKQVLCEKPFAMNAGEAQAMVDAAERTGNVLIEAYHYRFHPLFARVLELVRSGSIGAVREIAAHFNVAIRPVPGELRYDPALGGGAMMDLGCYCVHWARSVAGAEPEVLSASTVRHESGVDVEMTAVLGFPGGVRAELRTSMREDLPDGLEAGLVIAGELGSLRVVNPIAPHMGHALTLETADGASTEELAGDTTYAHQLRHVIDVLRGNAEPLTGGSDAVATMQVLDAIYGRAGMRPD